MEIIMFWKICFITPKSSRLIGTSSEGDFLLSPLGAGGITDFEELPILKYEIKNYKIL
jgi:hypothetical protein